MKRLWDAVIEPVLGATRPKNIVEIGSFEGENTRNLLAFCEKNNAVLHVVDPAPKYDVSELRERYGERFVFYEDLSLDVLPLIEDFDAVLIDGDHNWYTVYNELRLIEGLSEERSRDFPLVLLHDIFWPSGRRDLYYAPETIPEAYRKPHDPKGVAPGVEEPLEEGGLNQGLSKALQEGGPRNGVLTAVEDFLEETGRRLEFVAIPGFHGVGILFPPRLKANAEFAEVLETWNLPPAVSLHIERLEETWLKREVYRLEQHARLNRLKGHREQEVEGFRAKRIEMADARRRLQDIRRRLADVERGRGSGDGEKDRPDGVPEDIAGIAEELQLVISRLSSQR